jgi:hypothetical protein
VAVTDVERAGGRAAVRLTLYRLEAFGLVRVDVVLVPSGP